MMIGYPTEYCIKQGAYVWPTGSCTCWLQSVDKSVVWDWKWDDMNFTAIIPDVWYSFTIPEEYYDSDYQQYKQDTYVKTIDGSGQLNQDQKHATRRGVRPVVWVQLDGE